jgi:hypothetical protein
MSAATALIARYYDAIERRDLNAVLAATHTEVHFHDFLDGGEIEGLAAARDFYRRMFELSPDLDPISIETLQDGRVRAEFQSSVHSSSGQLWSDTRQVAIYTLVDGLIQGVELLNPTS